VPRSYISAFQIGFIRIYSLLSYVVHAYLVAVDNLLIENRRIVARTHGDRHGPITRVVSPSDIGERIKPFVFLDYFDTPPGASPKFGIHPHSGIATITVLLEGGVRYEDTTGKAGILPAGGVEFMRAAGGVWHDGEPVRGAHMRGLQLWIALPAAEESSPAESQYIAPQDVPQDGPVRVILGSYAAAKSPARAPSGSITCTSASRTASAGSTSLRPDTTWHGSTPTKGRCAQKAKPSR
jgi:redox-sensitive bicupin YhaK (pirin superfamily)